VTFDSISDHIGEELLRAGAAPECMAFFDPSQLLQNHGASIFIWKRRMRPRRIRFLVIHFPASLGVTVHVPPVRLAPRKPSSAEHRL
jgi:hypothetical protein